MTFVSTQAKTMSAEPRHTSRITGLTFLESDRFASSDESGRVLLHELQGGSWIPKKMLVDEAGPAIHQMAFAHGLLWLAQPSKVTAIDPDTGEVSSDDDIPEVPLGRKQPYEGMMLHGERPVLHSWRALVWKSPWGYKRRDVEHAHNIATPGRITSAFYDDAHGEIVVSTNHDVVQFYEASNMKLERSFSRKSSIVFRASDPSRIGVATLGGRRWALTKRGTGRGGSRHETAVDIKHAHVAGGRVLFSDGAGGFALHDEGGALLWSAEAEPRAVVVCERFSPSGDRILWSNGLRTTTISLA